jgi:hypothetical protein
MGVPGALASNIHKAMSAPDTAIEVYRTKQRSLLVIAPAPGTVAHDAWQKELDSAGDQLKRAEDRKIELSK